MKKMNPVVHFEMPAEDTMRMTKFYSKVFGWKAQQMGEEMGNYVEISTSEGDEKGMPKVPGMINGGFYKKTPDGPHPSFVIAVDDLKASIQEVNDAGGKVLAEPMDIPGIGKFVPFEDTEGNKCSMLQPLMK